jgi:hypothetical protein
VLGGTTVPFDDRAVIAEEWARVARADG